MVVPCTGLSSALVIIIIIIQWMNTGSRMSAPYRLTISGTVMLVQNLLHLHLHQFLNRGGHWGMTDDFTTSFLPFSLSSETCWTQSLSIPWCCLPTSFSVCLVFFPLSMCLARWVWPDLMNSRHVHITAVCVSLWWSGGLCVVQLPARSWHRFPHWQNHFWMRCIVIVSCGR